LRQRGEKMLNPLRLHVRLIWSADIRTFIPVQAEPSQIVNRLLRRRRFDAGRIDVLHPEDESAGARTDGEPGEQIGPRIANVLCPGG